MFIYGFQDDSISLWHPPLEVRRRFTGLFCNLLKLTFLESRTGSALRWRSSRFIIYPYEFPGRPAVPSLSLYRDFLSADLSLNWNVFLDAVGVPGTVLDTQGLVRVLSICFKRINVLFFPLNLLDSETDSGSLWLVSPRVPALRYKFSGRFWFAFSGARDSARIILALPHPGCLPLRAPGLGRVTSFSVA